MNTPWRNLTKQTRSDTFATSMKHKKNNCPVAALSACSTKRLRIHVELRGCARHWHVHTYSTSAQYGSGVHIVGFSDTRVQTWPTPQPKVARRLRRRLVVFLFRCSRRAARPLCAHAPVTLKEWRRGWL